MTTNRIPFFTTWKRASLGESIVVRSVKELPDLAASLWAPDGVLAVPHPTQLPDNAAGKVEDDGPNTHPSPAPWRLHETDSQSSQLLVSAWPRLAQPQLLQPFEEWNQQIKHLFLCLWLPNPHPLPHTHMPNSAFSFQKKGGGAGGVGEVCIPAIG